MRTALELGRFTFPAPLGYLNASKSSNTSLVHDPERGPFVRQAFEELATGQYSKQEVIARATDAGLRSRKGLKLSPQSFGQVMRNPIYVGRVESPDYDVSMKGNFEPLVDEATFYRAHADEAERQWNQGVWSVLPSSRVVPQPNIRVPETDVEQNRQPGPRSVHHTLHKASPPATFGMWHASVSVA